MAAPRIRPRPTHPLAWLKPLLFVLCLLPLLYQGLAALSGALGANPIEALIRHNGDWALRFLLITLCITPLRALTGWGWLMRLRRMLGLFAFFYASLHLSAYVGLDQFFAWRAIGEDILKRPYITLGMASYLLLIPLALTSNQAMMARLGGRRWQRLHRLVYLITLGGCVHFLLLVKADLREPLLYLGGFALLMLYRAHLYARREKNVRGTGPGRGVAANQKM